MYENNKNKLFVETFVTSGGLWLKVFMKKNSVLIRFLPSLAALFPGESLVI